MKYNTKTFYLEGTPDEFRDFFKSEKGLLDVDKYNKAHDLHKQGISLKDAFVQAGLSAGGTTYTQYKKLYPNELKNESFVVNTKYDDKGTKSVEIKPKRKRGRPKKDKDVVESVSPELLKPKKVCPYCHMEHNGKEAICEYCSQ